VGSRCAAGKGPLPWRPTFRALSPQRKNAIHAVLDVKENAGSSAMSDVATARRSVSGARKGWFESCFVSRWQNFGSLCRGTETTIHGGRGQRNSPSFPGMRIHSNVDV